MNAEPSVTASEVARQPGVAMVDTYPARTEHA
ncbi:MAG: hypothetical protein AW07_01234 [Candidatus Accumulibacter sp. SK-11]|nr:MAG: hypothetical protein AW07_01234 [Candidatus Accumulibacter sp. SK-11]